MDPQETQNRLQVALDAIGKLRWQPSGLARAGANTPISS